jgi:hypothetical protein
LDFVADFAEICEKLGLLMQKFAILGFTVADVDKLENERAASHNAGAAGQEIAADNRFENGRLPGALTANNGDLREINKFATNGIEHFLEFVDHGNKLLHEKAVLPVADQKVNVDRFRQSENPIRIPVTEH